MSFDSFIAAAEARYRADWKPAYASILAQLVEDALGSETKAPLRASSDQLVALVQDAFRSAAPQVRSALLGTSVPGSGSPVLADPRAADIEAAYRLGQMSFAQLVVSQSCAQRVDDEFFAVLKAEGNQAILQVLKNGEATLAELEAAEGADTCGVALKLRGLISYGVCEYRGGSESRTVLLTPVAQEYLAQPRGG